jgi:hypothetical protein
MRDYDADTGKIAHSGWIKALVERGTLGVPSGRRELRLLGLFVTVMSTVLFITQKSQSKARWFLAAGAIVALWRRCTSVRVRRVRRPPGNGSVEPFSFDRACPQPARP